MGKEKREKLESLTNVDGIACEIITPLDNEAVQYMGKGYKIGEEYLLIVSEDPYCAGMANAREVYEFLKTRYG